MSAFEQFVDTELPLRLSIAFPAGGNLAANKLLQTTGVGLNTKIMDTAVADFAVTTLSTTIITALTPGILSINLGTTDGNDNGEMTISGGGGTSPSRGATLWIAGNESYNTGGFSAITGNVSGAFLQLHVYGKIYQWMDYDTASVWWDISGTKMSLSATAFAVTPAATFSSTLQATGLSVGRAATYLLDVYSAAGLSQAVVTTGGGAGQLASVSSSNGTATLNLITHSATYGVGTTYGLNDQGNSFLSANGSAGGFGLGTTDSQPVVLGTNGTARITIAAAGAVTCASTLSATQLTSTIAIGTAPLVVTSTTVVANLNAALWDGYARATYIDQALLTTSTPAFGGLTLNKTGNAHYYSTLNLVHATTGYDIGIKLTTFNFGIHLAIDDTDGKFMVMEPEGPSSVFSVSQAGAGIFASTAQATGLSVGRALTTGVLDLYGGAAGGNICAYIRTDDADKEAGLYVVNDGGYNISMVLEGSAVGGGWANYAAMLTNATAGLRLGTTSATDVVIRTSNTARITIAAAGAVTCASTLQAGKITAQTSSGDKLVLKRAGADADCYIDYQSSAGAEQGFVGFWSSDKFNIYNGLNTDMRFYTNGTVRVTIAAAGAVTCASTLVAGSYVLGTCTSTASLSGTGGVGQALEVKQNTNSAGVDSFMAFHIAGRYALNLGIDRATNSLSVGGWSMGVVKYRVVHEGLAATVLAGTLRATSLIATTDIYRTAFTDYSGTSTTAGWASVTKNIYYKRIGKTMHIWFYLNGTAGGGSPYAATFTLPVAASATAPTGGYIGTCRSLIAATYYAGFCSLAASGSTVSCYPDVSGGGWAPTGTKGVQGYLCYETA